MDKVWILGCRGSVSISGADQKRYGGATTCVLARLDGQYVLLDAGTGIMNLPEEALCAPELPLLLTHLHLDHVIGLPMCPYLFRPEGRLRILAGRHEGLDAQTALDRLYAPPLWPVALSALPAAVRFETISGSVSLGPVRVDVMAGEHPNGVAVYRLSTAERRVVFATDCTLTPELLPRLTEFARDCDLLLCDGQYSPEEWAKRKDFGHNTWTAAAELAAACAARRYRVIHHDPSRTDAALDAAEEAVRALCLRGGMARQGEEIAL